MKKKLLIVIIALLVIVAGVFTYLYFNTDFLKSNKDLFMKYISKNSGVLEILGQDEILKTYNDKEKNTPYEVNGKLVFSDSFDTSQLTNLDADAQRAIKNTSITFEGSTDKLNKYSYRNFKLNYSADDSVALEYIQLNDVYGIKLDNIKNKYIAIENNNLKDLAKKLNLGSGVIQIIPDKFELDKFDYKSIFSDEEKIALKEKYSNILLQNLTDDMFSKGKSEEGTVYTLSLNMAQTERIFKQILSELKNDELIFSKMGEVIKNNFNVNESDISDYMNNIKNRIEDYINSENSTSSEKLNINVYVNNSKIVKTEFIFKDNKLSLIPSDYGFNLGLEADEQKDLITFEKKKTESDIEYIITSYVNNNKVLDLVFNFKNLDSLKKIEKDFKLELKTEEINIGYKYTETKEFKASVEKKVKENDIVTLNSAPNSQAIQNLFTQIGNEFNESNRQKKINAKILKPKTTNNAEEQPEQQSDSLRDLIMQDQELLNINTEISERFTEPILYFVPAALPYGMLQSLYSGEYLNMVAPAGEFIIVGVKLAVNTTLEADNAILKKAEEARYNTLLVSASETVALAYNSAVMNMYEKLYVQGDTEDYFSKFEENLKKELFKDTNSNKNDYKVVSFFDEKKNENPEKGYIVIVYNNPELSEYLSTGNIEEKVNSSNYIIIGDEHTDQTFLVYVIKIEDDKPTLSDTIIIDANILKDEILLTSTTNDNQATLFETTTVGKNVKFK